MGIYFVAELFLNSTSTNAYESIVNRRVYEAIVDVVSY